MRMFGTIFFPFWEGAGEWLLSRLEIPIAMKDQFGLARHVSISRFPSA